MTNPKLTPLLQDKPILVSLGLCYLYRKIIAQKQHCIVARWHHDIFQEKFRNTKSSEKSHAAFLNQTWRQKKKPDHSYIKKDEMINFFYVSIISPFYWTTYLKLYRLLHSFQEVYLLSTCMLSHVHFFVYKDKVYWQRSKKIDSILTAPAIRKDEYAILKQLCNCTAIKELSLLQKQQQLQGHSKLSQGLKRSAIQMSNKMTLYCSLCIAPQHPSGVLNLGGTVIQTSQPSSPPVGLQKELGGTFWVKGIQHHAWADSHTIASAFCYLVQTVSLDLHLALPKLLPCFISLACFYHYKL